MEIARQLLMQATNKHEMEVVCEGAVVVAAVLA